MSIKADSEKLSINCEKQQPPHGLALLNQEKAPSDQPPPVSDAPDGGFDAWLVVLGGWCTSFCSFGWVNSIGVFQEFYQTTYLRNYSASTISWIPSLQVFFTFASGPVIGKLYDRYGARYLTLAGTLLHVFGLMMASISTEYYQIMLSQGVCSAIGVALIFQPAISAVSGWFSKNRGAALGILATGSSIGGVIFPIMVTHLLGSVGYGWTMRICAFMILGLLAIANLTVKSRFPPKPQTITRSQLVAPFYEPAFVLTMIGLAIFIFGLFIPINYIVVEAMDTGMESSLAHYLVAILNAASLFGRVSTGFLADRMGKYNTFIIAAIATSLCTLALWLPSGKNTQAAHITFSALYGFFSGAYVSLLGGLIAQISPMREIGFRIGLVFLANSIGGLTTGPIAGAILALNNGSWAGVKVFAGVMCAAGSAFILAARVYKVGWKITAVF
ncbi:major facilitator superfamily domain-containing protein [Rhexocercosporidium sp. MPI-PUGE-AT-0058]|nr:major facilitator superfamily domain-containing protein [Rhexocercosporidium sp. MPI-PUGE-AT-0058]